MFIHILEEDSKEYFIALCIYAANIDGSYNKEEKGKIMQYAEELQLECDFDDLEDADIDDIIKTVRNMDFLERKVFLVELLGILLSDGIYGDREQEFFYYFANKIGVGKKKCEDLEEKVFAYIESYNNLIDCVNK